MSPEMLLALDKKLLDFQLGSGWRLSLPAKIVLQQAFLSLSTDYLGLKGYTNIQSREYMQVRVLDRVEDFLKDISDQARHAVDDQNLVSDDEKLIGAIYVMQHMKRLADMINCECWPG